MKLKSLLLQITFVLFLASINAQTTAVAVKVKDGETFILKKGGKAFTARLINIDAPEPKQHFGYKSFNYLYNLIQGKVLQYDSVGKDQRGHILVHAKFNGKRLDSLVIRNGWAWHNVNYSNDPVLVTAMNEASAEGVGFWSCGASKVCPPWLWKTYKSKDKKLYCKGCI